MTVARLTRRDQWKKISALMSPVLLAVYPVLAMFSINVGEISFLHVLRTLIISVIFAVGLTLSLFTFLHNQLKASLISNFWLLVFYTYGHIRDLLHEPLVYQFTRNEILLPVSVLLMIGVAVWVWRTKVNLAPLHTFFSLMIAVLMITVCFSLAEYYIPLSFTNSRSISPAVASQGGNTGVKPDIYYIILDGHGRQDILNDLYAYDDSEFIKHLEQEGFYIADASHSNYPGTMSSLSSSLNMEYLDMIGLPTENPQIARGWLPDKIKHSLVRQLLAEQGYQMVSFSNDTGLSVDDAEIDFNFEATQRAREIKNMSGLNSFESMFLLSTMGRIAFDMRWISALNDHQQYLYHYEQIRYVFTKLAEVPKMPGNYFVFAHILAPHPPFVFGTEGELVETNQPYSTGDGSDFNGTRYEYIIGYRNQITYIDHAVQDLIDNILANSIIPPIIIIQGDHGPGAYLDRNSIDNSNLDERLSILNAYYFPGDHASALYMSITPVNSFRVLFNEYFGMNFDLLDDRSYFSLKSAPFHYLDVTDMLTKISSK